MASGSVFLPSATWRAWRNWLAHCMVIPGRILFELNYIMKLNRTAKVKSHPCVFCCGETGRVSAPAHRSPTPRTLPNTGIYNTTAFNILNKLSKYGRGKQLRLSGTLLALLIKKTKKYLSNFTKPEFESFWIWIIESFDTSLFRLVSEEHVCPVWLLVGNTI